MLLVLGRELWVIQGAALDGVGSQGKFGAAGGWTSIRQAFHTAESDLLLVSFQGDTMLHVSLCLLLPEGVSPGTPVTPALPCTPGREGPLTPPRSLPPGHSPSWGGAVTLVPASLGSQDLPSLHFSELSALTT